MMETFAVRICRAVREKRTPLVVGMDPRWDLLPDPIRQEAVRRHGRSLEAVAAAYREFGLQVIDQVADLVPAIKFQAAFFEQAGVPGLAALAELVGSARRAGLVVILDGKRGDIGSTAEAYAEAYLGRISIDDEPLPVWGADAVTVHPYLGPESVVPFLRVAERERGGIFVLVRTSNPQAGEIQELKQGERTVCETVADWVEGWSSRMCGPDRYGPVGAVVAATVPEWIADLRRRMRHAIFLVPGYGAQGGTAADIAGAFDDDGLGALVNSSRGILYAFRNGEGAWAHAIRRATRAAIGELAAHTPAGRL